MTICQVCQKENPAGAEYCEDCGAALSVAAPTPVGAGVSGAGASPSPSTSPTPSAPAVPSVSTVPPTSASSSPAASPEATAEAGSSGASAPSAAPSTAHGAAPAPGAPSAAGAQAQAKLRAVRYGAPTGDEIPLFGQRLVVGRFDPETGPVDIDLSETAESGHISRQHGELYREADGPWTVRDLGSTNGVFVKGADAATFGPRITEPRPLTDGDEVAFGNARFIFTSS